jgi:hypothetical protein
MPAAVERGLPAEPFGKIELPLSLRLGRSLALPLGDFSYTLSDILTRGIGVGRPVGAPGPQNRVLAVGRVP